MSATSITAIDVMRVLSDGAETLRVRTVSGSTYTMTRTNGGFWDVVRTGVEGRKTFHVNASVFWDREINEFIVGPWSTTGVSEIEIL